MSLGKSERERIERQRLIFQLDRAGLNFRLVIRVAATADLDNQGVEAIVSGQR